MMNFLYFTTIFLFMALCALLCFLVLIQESKSSGLGASFGGEASDSLFGTSTADVLKKITGWLALIFLVACVVLSLWTNALGRTKTTSNVTDFTIENTG
jgi:preprotein translocase subunit SecG